MPSLTFPSFTQARVWLLGAICFVLPMKASFIYILSALLVLVWIAEGGWLEKFREVLSSKLCIACIAYYGVFVLGMLWTEDTAAGWKMVDRQTPFLLFLFFWSSAEGRYRERYIAAFLAGLCVCALLAHYNWVQLHWFPDWPQGVRVSKGPDDTAPFIDRLTYTPILALGAYFSLRMAVFSIDRGRRILAILTSGLLVSNLFFSGGRAGLVMLAVLCCMLAFERTKTLGKALLFSAILIPLVFLSAYSTHNYFAQRVDSAIEDIRTFEQNPNTSIGQRFVFWSTSFRIFLQNPLLGAGSGDFPKEYVSNRFEHWSSTPDIRNPHNQYLFTAATTGLLGLIALFYLFYAAAFFGSDMLTKSMLVGFAVVCLFESYLWRSNTTMTFSVILAALVAKNKRTSIV